MRKKLYIFLFIFLLNFSFVGADATSTSATTADESGDTISTTESTTEKDVEKSANATTTDEGNDESTTNSTSTADDSDSDTRKEVTIYIKKDSQIIFSGDVEINEEELEITDDSGTVHAVKKNNVLGVLVFVDSKEESFEITDMQYYSSLDSFILNCINYNNEELCNDWRYVVNGDYPSIGVDDYKLKDEDIVYVYYGQSKRLITPDEAYENNDFVIKAEEYDYKNNIWDKMAGGTVGIFQDDQDNYLQKKIITTSTIVDGEATFNLDLKGSYKAGFEDDHYDPFYEFEILENTDSEIDDSDGGGNGSTGGGSQNNSDSEFNIDKAVEYLMSAQEGDGSFGANLYTDWATVGLASVGESNNNLENVVRNSSTGSNLLDLIRRSMALMSLGLDPQSDYEENLIEKILDEFDGEQFGDPDIFNDDIFTLIVLQKLGFDEGDEEISKTIDFLLTKQSSNGRWEGVDLTAAAIQALNDFKNYDGVSESISNAENYLRSRQNNNGGWDNVYSTAWAMMAMSSLGYDFDDWAGDPLEYLGNLQDQDGGLLKDDTDNNRIWSTSYAIATASEKDWIEILKSFSIKSENEGGSNNSSGNGGGGENNDSNSSDDESNSGNSDLEETQLSSNISSNISDRFVDNLDQILSFLDEQEQQDLAQTNEALENQEQDEDGDGSESEIELVNTTEDIEDRILDSDQNNQNNQNQSEENNQENPSDNNSQTAAVLNALNFDWWIYLLLGIITSIISVIMFRRKI